VNFAHQTECYVPVEYYELISLQGRKTDFLENRVTEYKRSGVGTTVTKDEFDLPTCD